MNFRRRLVNVRRLIPNENKEKDYHEEESNRISEWLIENSEEFRESIRQLFRLQCKAGSQVDDWERWEEPYREQAKVYTNRINELIELYRGEASKPTFNITPSSNK